MRSFRHWRGRAFSLVEVVLALGVVAIAIVAILGMVPTGLTTSHNAQDDTRAAQIAQAVIASIASQAQTQFNRVQLPLDSSASAISVDLTTPGRQALYADNDGKLTSSIAGSSYQVILTISAPPTGFDTTNASQLLVTVAWPATAAPANQQKRNFVRIVTKY